jgi:hypothetical protein
MAGIPYEPGLLVLCGMDMNTTALAGNLSIARVQFEKICSAIANTVDGIRRNAISYDWRMDRR